MLLTIESLVVTICTTRLKIQKLYTFRTQCISVFYMGHRISSNYFATQRCINYSRKKVDSVLVMEMNVLGP